MVIEMQELLLARGFDLGSPDGMVGPATRAAIRAYQRSLNLPPDGFPTTELLERLRSG
jgi:peptidoglycan hydrolase-like protein with peptidoglycan-binding domain